MKVASIELAFWPLSHISNSLTDRNSLLLTGFTMSWFWELIVTNPKVFTNSND